MKLEERKIALIRLKELRYEIENSFFEVADIKTSLGYKSEWRCLPNVSEQYIRDVINTTISSQEEMIKIIEADCPREIK